MMKILKRGQNWCQPGVFGSGKAKAKAACLRHHEP
jgi:hypothetical protein